MSFDDAMEYAIKKTSESVAKTKLKQDQKIKKNPDIADTYRYYDILNS